METQGLEQSKTQKLLKKVYWPKRVRESLKFLRVTQMPWVNPAHPLSLSPLQVVWGSTQLALLPTPSCIAWACSVDCMLNSPYFLTAANTHWVLTTGHTPYKHYDPTESSPKLSVVLSALLHRRETEYRGLTISEWRGWDPDSGLNGSRLLAPPHPVSFQFAYLGQLCILSLAFLKKPWTLSTLNTFFCYDAMILPLGFINHELKILMSTSSRSAVYQDARSHSALSSICYFGHPHSS